jgi:hypothetical protein
MNTNHHITSQAELEELIGRYFDGETTIEEEQVLKQCLAECPWNSEAIDEARFTMGYFTAHKQQSSRVAKRVNRSRFTAIAASIAVLLAVGAGLLWQAGQADDVCVAYVNGKAIHNEKEILSLMHNDLNAMGKATQGLAEQLSSLGDAIEIDI